MNILFLSTENPYPPDHGHHLRTYYVLKRLAEEHRIYFVAFARTPKEVELKTELERFCASVDIFLLPHGRWRQPFTTAASLFERLPYMVARYRSRSAFERIRYLVWRRNLDLVHFDLPHLAAYLPAVTRLPKILTNHNVESLRLARWAQVEKNPLLKVFLYAQARKLAQFEAALCPLFERCVTVSDSDKEALVRLCGHDNFITLPNGVDVEYFRPGDTQRLAHAGLVWTGSMRGAYNRDAVDYFLREIAPRIRARLPHTPMTFVGSSPTPLLKQCARENPNLHFTGYVEDVRPFVDRALVFIAPLRSGSGTKVKILNAMAQARPVVTTSIGAEGIAASADQGQIVADAPAEFAEQVLGLLQNPERAAALGARARQVIEQRYAWKVVMAGMSRIYDEAVQAWKLKSILPKTNQGIPSAENSRSSNLNTKLTAP
ncbi:MAG: glycosyltransferase [bacterium]